MLRGCVDIDGRHNGACLSELGVSQGHADQLAVAVRSPIAPQEEEHDGVAAMIGERPGLSCLVGEREVPYSHAATIARRLDPATSPPPRKARIPALIRDRADDGGYFGAILMPPSIRMVSPFM